MSDNSDQAEYWDNRPEWVRLQPQMDAELRPVLELLLKTAPVSPGQSVLEIGCGTGDTLLALADKVGPGGQVRGIDISAKMLERAKFRTREIPQVTCQLGDAQVDDLGGPHDMAISRMGCMFFSDTPAAFTNIAKSLKPGAPIVMAAWGPMEANEWFKIPMRISEIVLGPAPRPTITEPGPLRFADVNLVRTDLEAAGLSEVSVTPVEIELTPPGTADEVADLNTWIGPAMHALRHHERGENARHRVKEALAKAYSTLMTPMGIRIPAQVNLITARA